jgi:hypothetical protein
MDPCNAGAAEATSGVLVGFEKNGEEMLSSFAEDHDRGV